MSQEEPSARPAPVETEEDLVAQVQARSPEAASLAVRASPLQLLKRASCGPDAAHAHAQEAEETLASLTAAGASRKVRSPRHSTLHDVQLHDAQMMTARLGGGAGYG